MEFSRINHNATNFANLTVYVISREGTGGESGEVYALSSGTLRQEKERVEYGGGRAAGRRDACVNLRFIALATADAYRYSLYRVS